MWRKGLNNNQNKAENEIGNGGRRRRSLCRRRRCGAGSGISSARLQHLASPRVAARCAAARG